tara:strand:+ start:3961 stop:4617 length:657 start_codon:yes stop_codon:yes gene_type:complete
MKQKPNYYAIISAEVRYDKSLSANAKLLYGEITCLTNENGFCFATNKYFADLYNKSKVTISKWISELVVSGYVSTSYTYKEGSKEIDKRYISILKGGVKENLKGGIKENFKGNNTSINNTSIIKEKIKKRKNFIVPTISEIEDYCHLRDNGISAEQFYDFYQSKGWLVGKTKMKDWKAAIRNWERNRKKSVKGMSKIHSHLQKNINVKEKLKKKYESN